MLNNFESVINWKRFSDLWSDKEIDLIKANEIFWWKIKNKKHIPLIQQF